MSVDAAIDKSSVTSDYQIDDENFLVDLVKFSRSRQVANEAQTVVSTLGALTGFLSDWRDNVSLIVTGGTSSGKSHMMREVTLSALEFCKEGAVYELSGGSDKAAIDDEALDDADIAYFHELQKIPDEILEFIKSVSEDGGFKYGRNVADSDRESGRKTVHIERDPITVIFTFADENAASVDDELSSRSIEVKVDESPEKNAAVHDMKWGHGNLSAETYDHEYIFEDRDLWTAVRKHLYNMPRGMDVVFPTDDNRFEGDEWDAAAVAKPLFNFERNESTRASAMVGSLFKAAALSNYHVRDRVCEECYTVYDSDAVSCDECQKRLSIVPEPVDLASIIEVRDVLLALTHNLTEKKFHIIDAIVERGGPTRDSDTAVQAEKSTIVEYVQENESIATMSKSQITNLLDEMDEELVINKKDHPEDARKNIYVFDGGKTFQAPKVTDYPEHFADVRGPVSGDRIGDIIDRQLESLNSESASSVSAVSEPPSDVPNSEMETDLSERLTESSDGDEGVEDTNHSELTETERAVAEALETNLDGYHIPADVIEENSLKVEHMVGDTPTTIEVEGNNTVMTPRRDPSGADLADGFIADLDDGSPEENRETVEETITSLKEKDVFSMEATDYGAVVSVEP